MSATLNSQASERGPGFGSKPIRVWTFWDLMKAAAITFAILCVVAFVWGFITGGINHAEGTTPATTIHFVRTCVEYDNGACIRWGRLPG